MLVSAKDMLEKAREGKYAVGQFNINNLEWTKSVLLTAEELKSPVILGVSEGAGKYMTGFKTVAAMVEAMMEELNITVPVALHLDHGTYDGCYKCIKAGFSSIMFDGSHYPIEENIEKTKELVKVAHAMGLSLEAEVGSIGGEEDGVVGLGECADPQECKAIADLGIDFLAAGIGSCMADLLGGYFIYVPITFAIKGLVAFSASHVCRSLRARGINPYAAVAGCGVIDIVLVAGGYCMCEVFLYGLGAALASVPSNIIQGISGLIISSALYPVLQKPLSMALKA